MTTLIETATTVVEDKHYEILELPLKVPVFLVRVKGTDRVMEATHSVKDAVQRMEVLEGRVAA